MQTSNDCYGERGVVSAYEDKGLILLEKKIYSKYLTRQKARILDIGCFVGRVSFPLAEKGFEVFGIDIASIALRRANELKKKNKMENVHFLLASGASIPFKKEVFDYVLLPCNVLDNISSKKLRIASLQEASRTLNKNGLILFSAHNRFYPKYFFGIILVDILRLLFKALIVFKLVDFIPFINKEFIKQIASTKFGSILWIEPGGKKYSKWIFSTFLEIKKILKLSSLEIIEKIPVMVHSPQEQNADILPTKIGIVRAPIFYYICGTKQH